MPLEPLNCLESLVGLAPAALPCFPLPDGDTDWITQSSRTGSAGGGVYISSLAGLSFQAAKGEAASDLYDKLGKARKNAADYVRTAIQQSAKYAFGSARYSQSGTLGKPGNGSPYAGEAILTIRTNYQEAGAYRVTALGLQTTTAVMGVPIRLNGVQVASIATNAGLVSLQEPFTIPFDGETHTLTAALPTGVRPLVGQLFCPGCSSGSPFAQSVARGLYGVTAATSSAGFQLRVQEVCAAEDADLLCYATTANDEIADSLAKAVRALAGYFFLMELFSMANYSRYTLLDQKQMVYLANEEFKKYGDEMVAWLAGPTGLGRLQHPCYTCTPLPGGPRIHKTF